MKYFADEDNNPFFNDTRMAYLIYTCYKNIQIRNRSPYFWMNDSNIVIKASSIDNIQHKYIDKYGTKDFIEYTDKQRIKTIKEYINSLQYKHYKTKHKVRGIVKSKQL